MQKATFILGLILLGFLSCTKKPAEETREPISSQISHRDPNGNFGTTAARPSGSNYSQSIPVESANQMIGSYLNAVGYPGTDTTLRSMVFDADTLRAYLMNSNIVTLKVMLAHKPEYSTPGNQYLGNPLNPQAVTLVMVGLNQNDQFVFNSRGEVYDHLISCPTVCPGNGSAIIQ